MSGHWRTVRGVLVEGHKVASGGSKDSPVRGGTIAKQIPFFRKRGLDLSTFHPATLNINISPKILILARPRYTFRWVKWLPDQKPEDFSFSPCRLTFKRRVCETLIYYPHPETKLRHPHPPSLVEIIAPFIKGIQYGDSVQLAVNTEEVALLDSPNAL